MALGTVTPNSIAQTQSNQSDQLTSALGKNDGMDKNAFLKLLVAQMKNQDPLKPMDNTDFVAQLAQFSNLEQVMGINTRLDTLAAQGQGMQNTQIAGLVGKTVTLNGKSVNLDGSGTGAAFAFSLPTASAQTTITIIDSTGKVVRTMDGGTRPAGMIKMAWDGKSDAGIAMPAGTYSVSVAAQNSAGAPISVTQNGSGVVRSVSFEKSTPEIELDNGLVAPVSDLLDIQSTPTTAP